MREPDPLRESNRLRESRLRMPKPGVELLVHQDRQPGPELTPEQDRVVRHRGGALLVLGSPGSGKTTVLAEALIGRLHQGTTASRVLALVPDRGAVRRWREYLSGRGAAARSAVFTFHGFAVQTVLSATPQSGEKVARLLTEEDRIRVLSEVVAKIPAQDWPQMFATAVGSTAFAARVADFLARAVEHGWTPSELASTRDPVVGPLWPLLARAWQDYRDVLDLAGVMDYQDLLLRAAHILRQRNSSWDLVVVDDYQELDAVQRQVLSAVVSGGADFIAAGNPDQASNRFRGADPAAIADFRADYARPNQPAQFVVLAKTHRFGSSVATAVVPIIERVAMPGVPVEMMRTLRRITPAEHDSTVDLLTYGSGHEETTGVAQVIRRYGLSRVAHNGEPRWSEVAVLVRTSAEVAAWEQTLLAADIPVSVAPSDRSLRAQPTVRMLLAGLRTAALLAGLAPRGGQEIDAAELLTSPMGGASPATVAELGRHLRASAVAAARPLGVVPATADQLLAQSLLEPGVLAAVDVARFPAAARVVALHDRLRRSAAVISGGGSVAEALWQLWSDDPTGPSSWGESLRVAALVDDRSGRAAHGDLDAVLACFVLAERTPVRGGQPGVLTFLEQFSQEVAFPANLELPPRNAVEICTVHRAKGRQWPVVVMPGLQEGRWPGQGSALGLLGEDKLARTGSGSWQDDLADERRLFVLGCTRAQQHLLVTAVDAGAADSHSDPPSRFCSELGVAAQVVHPSNAARSLSAAGVVASLRMAAADSGVAEPLRLAARHRLAELAQDRLFAAADPDTWWAVQGTSATSAPLWPTQSPLTLSITGLVDLAECPRRWLLDRVLQARPPRRNNTSVGLLVHRVSQAWANGEISRDLAAASEVTDAIWAGLDFAAPWQSRAARVEVTEQIQRLLSWHQIHGGSIAFAERSFAVETDWPEPIRLRGKADLGLVDSAGGLALIDLKTTRTKPTQAAVDNHVQLAGYQWAANAGAFVDVAKGSAGAALLFSSIPHGTGSVEPKQMWQAPLTSGPGEPGWFDDVLADAVTRLRSESFPAIASAGCQHCPFQSFCPAKVAHWEEFDGC